MGGQRPTGPVNGVHWHARALSPASRQRVSATLTGVSLGQCRCAWYQELRNTRPGSAPVCLPSSSSTWPLTIVM